ncbi:cobalamin-binding protein [Castellaniella sp.]|uniref:cobalamin-binding protein n=1 Tax=Castellaniella sp. TaxID=1955812 RepID=UPI002AFE27D1|nr:cobalamin-binding protein [Castellaniella sp.]
MTRPTAGNFGRMRRCLPRLAAAVCLGLGLAWTGLAGAAAQPRIITLAPSATELVYAAGAGADIVGTVLRSDHPPAARAIPRIGDGIQFSEERILTLHPTLVIGWQPSDGSRSLARRLEPLGVPLIYADPKSLDDIPALIRDLGERLGTQLVADAAADTLARRIRALIPAPPPRQTVFIEISADPLYTLGKDPLINDLLARCGGVNPYANSRVAAPQVSVESVLHLNPHVLILSPYGTETLAVRSQWWANHGLPAARQGRIYAVDPDWLHRPGPRLVDAAEAICADLRDARTRP